MSGKKGLPLTIVVFLILLILFIGVVIYFGFRHMEMQELEGQEQDDEEINSGEDEEKEDEQKSSGIEELFGTGVSTVGEEYNGGYIFYEGENYVLIANKNDIEVNGNNTFEWGCYGEDVNASEIETSDELGEGKNNTEVILNANCLRPEDAVALCDDLESEGYDDWFLPSRQELYAIYQNLYNHDIGDFSRKSYWSSSNLEKGSWSLDFDGGGHFGRGKHLELFVRCSRIEMM